MDTRVSTHLELARDVAEAMAAGRWDDVIGHLSADVVVHVPGRPEPLRGVDEVAGFVLETAAKTDDGEHLEVVDVMSGEHYAAIHFHITATRAGREPLDNRTVHLARIEDGTIAEIWFHNFDSEAVAAFWE